MIWVIALAGIALTGAMSFLMGVRVERGKHARWAAIQEIEVEARRRQGGVTLKKVRITR